MLYTIYKITNQINNKIYIGKHQTKDLNDNYMGSGKLLVAAIKKYGIENFKKEILFVFDNELEMNSKEAELVTKKFVKESNNYNLCPGGNGGFGYINSTPGLHISNNTEIRNKWKQSLLEKYGVDNYAKTKEWKKRQSKQMKKLHSLGKIKYDTFTGKKHTDETKKKISEANSKHQKGRGNSQFGTMWITNGQENKKIKKEIDIIPEGWHKGRVTK